MIVKPFAVRFCSTLYAEQGKDWLLCPICGLQKNAGDEVDFALVDDRIEIVHSRCFEANVPGFTSIPLNPEKPTPDVSTSHAMARALLALPNKPLVLVQAEGDGGYFSEWKFGVPWLSPTGRVSLSVTEQHQDAVCAGGG